MTDPSHGRPGDYGTRPGRDPGPRPSRAPTATDPLRRVDRLLAKHVALSPYTLIGIRFVLSLPVVWALLHGLVQPAQRGPALALFFGLYMVLDYADGVVARIRDQDSSTLRVLDRIVDLPILLTLVALTYERLVLAALAAKLLLDAVLLVMYARGLGSNYKRLRAMSGYVSVFGLLMLSQGWAPLQVTPELVSMLLWINAGVSLTIVLRRLKWLSRKRIADALSIGNLACGVLAMVYAQRHQLDVSLMLLTLGAALDGMDGAAARRWGGSPLGVYMDDIADGVSYGLAPGFAVYAISPQPEGAVIGGLFACFVIARLVFFTLNKADSDPAYFSGVPSPAGGITTMSSLVLFHDRPLLVGFLVGTTCTLMITFDAQHRHLGRALASRRMRAYAALFLAVLALSAALSGFSTGVAIVLTTLLAYGFSPSIAAFRRVLASRSQGGHQGVSDDEPSDDKPAPRSKSPAL
jgi:CDP-diacylglycerol--serine O-phosphatidyltransferase